MTIKCDYYHKSTDIIVNRYETIGKAKEKYFGRVGSRYYNQWVYDAEILSDDKTFDYYGIEDQDNITVYVSCK